TPIPLPLNAPYGSLNLDIEACTLCLSCASLCPTGALADNPDLPQLRFQEDACLQCGLCIRICPENALTLHPQLDLTDQALSQTVLHEEEPFACVECGKLFGVKSTIEKITEKLAGKHTMFATSDAARLIQMCENCRVESQFHSTDNPFQSAERPRVVTTDDYLSKRRDH
ncbi:MAG: 4Fe-4S binding protein, partial [Hyphomicrobiales bacterium]